MLSTSFLSLTAGAILQFVDRTIELENSKSLIGFITRDVAILIPKEWLSSCLYNIVFVLCGVHVAYQSVAEVFDVIVFCVMTVYQP